MDKIELALVEAEPLLPETLLVEAERLFSGLDCIESRLRCLDELLAEGIVADSGESLDGSGPASCGFDRSSLCGILAAKAASLRRLAELEKALDGDGPAGVDD